MKNIYCVIMAGGVGSRFWPMSREDKPKQFIDILGIGKTFIRQTYERFTPMVRDENFIVVTSSKYKSLVLEQIPELKPSQVLCEPMRRNTAPCIAYAAYRIMSIDPDAVMVVTPADHLITNTHKFEEVVKTSVDYADSHNSLMTIGIQPSKPETGYGYIQIDPKSTEQSHPDIYKVKTFTEKPNVDIAKVFVESGEFFWNSGIFVWNVKTILNAINSFIPDINSLFIRGIGTYSTDKEQQFIETIYPKCENISIDYGVMEKADNVNVICADFGWSDIGTWSALYEHSDKDENSNSVSTKRVIFYDSKGCVVRAPDDKVVIIDGLENYIVIDSGDSLLITPLHKEQSIKNYVEDVRVAHSDKYL
ncbi:MAG: mannose-1-phosphate guanylyltransferase [Rikenellaceae bacterium]